MHEITLCQSAFEIIDSQAKLNNAKKVKSVWMEIGALSCVEVSALEFCFDIVCRDTLAQGCELHIEVIPAKAWCWDCHQVVTVSTFNAGCPSCGSQNLRVENDDAMRIKQIEIE
ncbi:MULTISPECIES: hydrogenase maturation nickel metallochaperone HypA [Enterobacterales]|uniref:Hydrogenase maturation factor HybF n=3 Tax=Proteus TaxID=583 RepID=A0AAW7CYK0_9GAMM|nr:MULTISPECIES: hydrogenase maturation nickel metallochaperone HypA [Enterobacterales]MBG2804027.1 hydrogenase maturation nickel metallochaperone HypA [Proteus mirabilis]MDO5405160.1 hydrogenase maturation nickel metallochaperone HypA [Proteus sp. (in: enterobacteria)]WOO50280.1 hydrogenase maturation nickel metallochaperone HypA [Hafnia alvei]MBG2877017.1 hydrogenase maturation nickel metallochaperone HypA [Proteus alimentorum]MBG2880345.1 hydrogenase maturation nickel metallochaperone HypA 